MELAGEPSIVAGVNVELSGFGGFDGIWHVKTARHQVSRGSGYTTGLSLRRPLGY